ncbi:MAG: hypothetical protein OXG46_00035 [Chloroflexi bacterium]|nr:hypothetical protein [Chloroflexota bacterium]MCY3937192.1 hypothetical protein [Chloroflexota bacterium]
MIRPRILVGDYKAGLKARAIDKNIELSIEGCLGLCSPSNVAVLSMRGGNQWFGRINSRMDVANLLDYVAESVDEGRPAAPSGDIARNVLRFR